MLITALFSFSFISTAAVNYFSSVPTMCSCFALLLQCLYYHLSSYNVPMYSISLLACLWSEFISPSVLLASSLPKMLSYQFLLYSCIVYMTSFPPIVSYGMIFSCNVPISWFPSSVSDGVLFFCNTSHDFSQCVHAMLSSYI